MIPIANPIIGTEEKEKVLEVMDSGMLACGQYVTEFEEKFTSILDSKYGIATSSGTTALEVALKAAGIKEGDKVLTTPFTFIASSNAILYCGAVPVFADVNEDSFNIDAEAVSDRLKEDPEIKALLIVHLYGQTCDMNHIMELVDEYNLILIEDCAQAHGAGYRGKKAGTFGDASIFSFYPTKNMTTSEGGMVVTDSEEIRDKSRQLINHGSSRRYYHQILGYNYRMTNIEAAIGLAQLKHLTEFNHSRQQHAAFLTDNLKDIDWLQTPVVKPHCHHVFHQYTLQVENRDGFASYLDDHDIGYGIYYPLPIYRQPLYQERGYGGIELTVTERLSEKVISIPVHPALERDQLQTMVEVIRDWQP